MTRPPVTFRAADEKGTPVEPLTVDHAIFVTDWSGTVPVAARSDGT